jgi:hypothetical protein
LARSANAPPYAGSLKRQQHGSAHKVSLPVDGLAVNSLVNPGVVAAMRSTSVAVLDRRLFKPRKSTTDRKATTDGAVPPRSVSPEDDPLFRQSSEQCTTCGATRTYAPKGKSLPPFCEYASEVTHECRRGVGATTCGLETALGGSMTEKRLCGPLSIQFNSIKRPTGQCTKHNGNRPQTNRKTQPSIDAATNTDSPIASSY